jgi:hypothetical protein
VDEEGDSPQKNMTNKILMISSIALMSLFVSGCTIGSVTPTKPPATAVTNFEECAVLGNPIMESYPRQCRANGQTFVEKIDNPIIPPVEGCKDECGDGICAEIVCQSIGCPCAETKESCPKDCGAAVDLGSISGKVTVGPICPVERVDNPCVAPPEAYTSREVIVYLTDGKTVVARKHFNADGTYSFNLKSGNYILGIPQTGIGGGSELPHAFTVKAGDLIRFDFSIDTGIR